MNKTKRKRNIMWIKKWIIWEDLPIIGRGLVAIVIETKLIDCFERESQKQAEKGGLKKKVLWMIVFFWSKINFAVLKILTFSETKVAFDAWNYFILIMKIKEN